MSKRRAKLFSILILRFCSWKVALDNNDRPQFIFPCQGKKVLGDGGYSNNLANLTPQQRGCLSLA